MSTNPPDWKESPDAIAAVDALFASVGLEHGRRATRVGTWAGGERIRRPRTSQPVASPRPKARSLHRAPGIIRPPGWEAFPWLHAGFSTREGGATTAYGNPGDLNLGWNTDDPAETVAVNRKRFLEAVAGPHFAKSSGQLVAVRQFHSNLIRIIGPDTSPLATAEGKPVLRGDGLITAEPGRLLAILTADCVPVLVVDTRRRVVAAFHAGWRGTLARIVQRGIGTMRLQFGSRPKDLIAAIGPGIGPCCYSVGEEIRFDFESQFAYAPSLFTEVYDSDPVRDKYPLLFLTARAPGHSNIGPQIHLDLIDANRRQLLDAGLSTSKISVAGECTACTRLPDGQRRYFSHREEHGYTGRMLSLIGIAAP